MISCNYLIRQEVPRSPAICSLVRCCPGVRPSQRSNNPSLLSCHSPTFSLCTRVRSKHQGESRLSSRHGGLCNGDGKGKKLVVGVPKLAKGWRWGSHGVQPVLDRAPHHHRPRPSGSVEGSIIDDSQRPRGSCRRDHGDMDAGPTRVFDEKLDWHKRPFSHSNHSPSFGTSNAVPLTPYGSC